MRKGPGGGGGGGGGGLVLFERVFGPVTAYPGVCSDQTTCKVGRCPIFLFLLLSYSNIFFKHFCLLVFGFGCHKLGSGAWERWGC